MWCWTQTHLQWNMNLFDLHTSRKISLGTLFPLFWPRRWRWHASPAGTSRADRKEEGRAASASRSKEVHGDAFLSWAHRGLMIEQLCWWKIAIDVHVSNEILSNHVQLVQICSNLYSDVLYLHTPLFFITDNPAKYAHAGMVEILVPSQRMHLINQLLLPMRKLQLLLKVLVGNGWVLFLFLD